MVEGPITGTEINFPNLPVVDEEFQATNKFVYQWTDENRWKNIHRPLVVSDNLWGTTDDPDADDWVKDVVPVNVSGGGFNVLPFTSKTEPKFDAYSGSVTALYMVQERPGESEYTFPYEWVQGNAQYMNGRFLHQPLLIDNTFWYINITFLDIAPSSEARVVMPVHDLGDPSKLDEVTFKLTVSCKHVWLGGLDSVPFQNEFSIYGRRLDGTSNAVSGGAAGDFGTMQRNQRIEGLSIQCNFPATNIGEQYWVVFELSQDPSFYYYDVIAEIEDPYGPANPNFYPVGFSTNSSMDRSMVTFEGDPLAASIPPPKLLQLRHNEPGTLGDTVTEQVFDSTTFRDVNTKATEEIKFTAIHCQDSGEGFVGARDDTNTLEYRHMRVPYDLSTTGDTVFDAEMDYDFTDFASESPVLTGEIKDISVDPNGFYVYILLDTSINRYILSTAWDVSSLDPNVFTTLDVSGFDPTMFTMTLDGRIVLLGKSGVLKQIILDNPWDFTGAIDTGTERAFAINDPVGITVSPDNKTMLVLDIPAVLDGGYELISFTKA